MGSFVHSPQRFDALYVCFLPLGTEIKRILIASLNTAKRDGTSGR